MKTKHSEFQVERRYLLVTGRSLEELAVKVNKICADADELYATIVGDGRANVEVLNGPFYSKGRWIQPLWREVRMWHASRRRKPAKRKAVAK
jgi:hypothetical protein